MLRPRVRIIADERLTGAPRDAVQARLDLWLKTHIERLLEPLFRLTAADELAGMARGIAFQLVEALGVLDRRKVTAEVKSLDQPERATLRKFGVRFGAYHLYVPPLIKPAPRSLAVQLWALKHADRDSAGIDAIERLASSGRTSIAIDNAVDKALYAIAGYRVCGERAVRVDMLERLADVIRPAMAWRPGAPGAKPAAAFDGSGAFTVVVAMTSLVGCAGEDFAAILRSLGYRMDKRPRPPAPVTEAPAPEPVAEAPTPDAAAPDLPAVEAPIGELAPVAAVDPELQPATVDADVAAAAATSEEAPPRDMTADAPPLAETSLPDVAAEPVVEAPVVEEPVVELSWSARQRLRI